VAVGTPHRLHRLSALGALKLDQLALLIIDMEPDVKGPSPALPTAKGPAARPSPFPPSVTQPRPLHRTHCLQAHARD
jgi:hypothetical protein